MGPSLSRDFAGATHLFSLIGFFVRSHSPFLRPDALFCSRRRAQEPSRLAVAPTFPHCSALARPYLDGSEHDGTLDAIGTTIRGELAIGRESSRRNLVFGRSIGT